MHQSPRDIATSPCHTRHIRLCGPSRHKSDNASTTLANQQQRYCALADTHDNRLDDHGRDKYHIAVHAVHICDILQSNRRSCTSCIVATACRTPHTVALCLCRYTRGIRYHDPIHIADILPCVPRPGIAHTMSLVHTRRSHSSLHDCRNGDSTASSPHSPPSPSPHSTLTHHCHSRYSRHCRRCPPHSPSQHCVSSPPSTRAHLARARRAHAPRASSQCRPGASHNSHSRRRTRTS